MTTPRDPRKPGSPQKQGGAFHLDEGLLDDRRLGGDLDAILGNLVDDFDRATAKPESTNAGEEVELDLDGDVEPSPAPPPRFHATPRDARTPAGNAATAGLGAPVDRVRASSVAADLAELLELGPGHLRGGRGAGAPASPPSASGADPGPTPSANPAAERSDIVEQLRRELRESHDKAIRAAANFDNYRKRLAKEQEEGRLFALEGLLRDLLPSVDNLELAIGHSDHSTSDRFVDGIRMVHKHLMQTLRRYGLEPFQAAGTPFDPVRHQAMNQVTRDDVPSGTVVAEAQSGYLLHGRLLRPAMVTVAKAGGAGAQPAAAQVASREGADGDVPVHEAAPAPGAGPAAPESAEPEHDRPDGPDSAATPGRAPVEAPRESGREDGDPVDA